MFKTENKQKTLRRTHRCAEIKILKFPNFFAFLLRCNWNFKSIDHYRVNEVNHRKIKTSRSPDYTVETRAVVSWKHCTVDFIKNSAQVLTRFLSKTRINITMCSIIKTISSLVFCAPWTTVLIFYVRFRKCFRILLGFRKFENI